MIGPQLIEPANRQRYRIRNGPLWRRAVHNLPKNLQPLDQPIVVPSEQISNARSAPLHCTHQSLSYVAHINQIYTAIKIGRNLALTERNRKTGWRRLISIPRSNGQRGTAYDGWSAGFCQLKY